MVLSPHALTVVLKEEACRLGFDLVGATPAVTPPGIGHFRQWLADGFAGPMHFMADRAAAYEHPRHVLPGVRSLLMLAVAYRTAETVAPRPGQGVVARYACGADYHDLIRQRLHALADLHRRLVPGGAVRGVVDTAPLLERQFAQLAGLGWFGKNTTLLNQRWGSWFVLAALLSSETLAYDPTHESNHCGRCRRCLDACPTGALVAPYRLDARRCISCLTIELSEQMPAELRPAVGQRVFGCDVCQEVCPWNRPVAMTTPTFLSPLGNDLVELTELFSLDEAALVQRFQGTPLVRAGRRGMLRNAALALGNRPHPPAVSALTRGLDDAEPLVRGACAWALGRYGDRDASAALAARLAVETDPAVRREIEVALAVR